MRNGAWLQLGDRSHILALEILKRGVGVGVIISPKDLKLNIAIDYSNKYSELGVEIVIDQQFYIPSFENKNTRTYSINEHRASISKLNKITDEQRDALSKDLETISRNMKTSCVVAPAVLYEANRTDIARLNSILFDAAKRAGDSIGIPTYATVTIGNSAISSMDAINDIISNATALNADGWYFAFEFTPERVPSSTNEVYH